MTIRALGFLLITLKFSGKAVPAFTLRVRLGGIDGWARQVFTPITQKFAKIQNLFIPSRLLDRLISLTELQISNLFADPTMRCDNVRRRVVIVEHFEFQRDDIE